VYLLDLWGKITVKLPNSGAIEIPVKVAEKRARVLTRHRKTECNAGCAQKK